MNKQPLRPPGLVSSNRCLTYVPVPHLGVGFVQSCVSLLEHFDTELLSSTLLLPKTFQNISPAIELKEALPLPLKTIPYRLVARFSRPLLDSYFRHAIASADPITTLAYFWPAPSQSLVQFARRQGLLAVREMINTCMATAKVILDEAYERLGLRPSHGITNDAIDRELQELAQYDYIFASNRSVELSLGSAGIPQNKILSTTFGWDPCRYPRSAPPPRSGFRALFVGSIGVRKGVPQLLEAWKRSGVDGELVLAGQVERALDGLVRPYLESPNIRLVGFVSDPSTLYRSADVFVFPTLEEGGPQVTFEAAGFGLPVVTTEMGSARMIVNGVNGLIIEPFDIDGLAQAIVSLANNRELRNRLALRAAKDAENYTYQHVGRKRARMLSSLLVDRS
jgi:glycosyltransferase involved in cell wall biosynthesis